jgi:peroxiredoxin
MAHRLFALGIGLGLVLGPLGAADIPRPAPELAVQLAGGGQVLLSQYRGKVVLIAFVHTTCPHCQHASAIIQQLYKEYGPRGFQPIGVAFNDAAAVLVPDFVSQLGLTYPVGVAPRETVMTYLQYSYVVPLYVPQLVFVDRKGTIRAQHGGGDDFFKEAELESNLRSQIESLLKEPVPKKPGTVHSLTNSGSRRR